MGNRISDIGIMRSNVDAENKEPMWVIEVAKIHRQCVVSRAAYQTQT
jgi:hypothetical protein